MREKDFYKWYREFETKYIININILEIIVVRAWDFNHSYFFNYLIDF